MHDSYTLAHLFVALKLNDLVCMVKLMIRLTWMTQPTGTALLVDKEAQVQVWTLWSLLECCLPCQVTVLLLLCPGNVPVISGPSDQYPHMICQKGSQLGSSVVNCTSCLE